MQAARDAIAADTDLLLPLLHDPEHDSAVRVGLVLAIAQLVRAHQDSRTVVWMRTCWPDPTRPREVRVSAALGWMCLIDLPVPDELRAMLDDFATHETDRLMAPLPWMRAAENTNSNGLHRCLSAMLHPDTPYAEDRWDAPWS
ncbi:hypothetical protein [Streptomyces sp. NPDC002671]